MSVAILQARMSSRRLPGKVMAPILGMPMLARQIERIGRASRVQRLVVATSDRPSDDPIAGLCERIGVACFRGSLEDVLGRFTAAVRAYPADTVVRLTADCPLTDWRLIDECIALHERMNADYTSNIIERTYADGLDVEVMKRAAIEAADREASAQDEREHVTPYLYRHPERFRIVHMRQDADEAAMRWTVDNEADLDMTRAVYAALHSKNPDFDRHDVLKFLQANIRVAEMNHALG
ncbi:cytidylyltransferase domain-containing protein [Terricaulis sp.]|uniref:cytidylyltransferase domain-containing protein n=1 Tax=Terricaulis sp. TaxID=2768686 RepID=UPI0037831ADF